MEREQRTILLVDGNAADLFYLAMLLKRLEYNVETARSAEDAFRRMDEAVPSLVLTDITLPSMSGIDLLRKMKQTPLLQEVPVVVLTAEADPKVQDECMRLGCAAYLHRPAEPDLLFRTLQSASESVPRGNIRLQTSIKVIVGDGTVMGGAARTEYATALSEGGLFVCTLYPQPKNALTPVRIFLPSGEIAAKALVLYSFTMAGGPFKEPGMGMKFVEISEESRHSIRNFIRHLLTDDLTPQPDRTVGTTGRERENS